MNILFYKLLAREELKRQSDYILKSRDSEYNLENFILCSGYNPLEKLKELEDELDSQLYTTEISEVIESKANFDSLEERVQYLKELDTLINERFKFYGVFILKKIYEYLLTKEIK